MAAAWLIATLLASAELSAGERAPIALLIAAPHADRAFASKAEVRSAIIERLEADTAFTARDAPDALLASCKGAITCIARGLPREAGASRLLLIVTLVDRAGGARLDVTLVDIARAQDEDEAGAVLARRPDLPTKDVIELGSSVRGLFETDLRPIFERGGMWRPFGALEIYGANAGLELLIDGVRVGQTQPGTTRVANVPVGSRDVVLRDSDGNETRAAVMVRVAAVAPIDLRRNTSSGLARAVTFWSSVGTAAAGLTLVAVEVARAGSRAETICFRGSPDCHEDRELASGLAPFGLGLVTFGGSTALGTLLFGGDDELPWIQVVIGVAAGVATYGLSTALD